MASSELRAIYKSLEEVSVRVGDTDVRVRGLDNLKTSVNKANLPLRLLLPVGSTASGRNLIINTADGSGRQGVWTIPDLMLWALETSGQGLEDYAGTLVDYCVEYERAILSRRTDHLGWIHNNLALDTGMFEWPLRSDVWYYGARGVHTITELI
jgi:hypothetical protein